LIKKEAVPKGLLHQFFRLWLSKGCACYKRVIKIASIKRLLSITHIIPQISAIWYRFLYMGSYKVPTHFLIKTKILS
jgi:hypothetical protein